MGDYLELYYAGTVLKRLTSYPSRYEIERGDQKLKVYYFHQRNHYKKYQGVDDVEPEFGPTSARARPNPSETRFRGNFGRL